MKYVNSYNTVEFYVGDITEPQTINIYTDSNTSVDIEVSEGNKWYTYVLPKDKGLCMIEGDSVKKVVVKANISYKPNYITSITTFKRSFYCRTRNNFTISKRRLESCFITDIRFNYYLLN